MADAKPYPKTVQLHAGRKPYRRIVASRKTWEQLRDQRLGPCVLCAHLGIPQIGDSELHHVVPRDRYGDDVAENLVSLCRACHRDVEDRRHGAPALLAAAVQQSEQAVYAYAIDRLGEDGFLRLHGVTFGGEAA